MQYSSEGLLASQGGTVQSKIDHPFSGYAVISYEPVVPVREVPRTAVKLALALSVLAFVFSIICLTTEGWLKATTNTTQSQSTTINIGLLHICIDNPGTSNDYCKDYDLLCNNPAVSVIFDPDTICAKATATRASLAFGIALTCLSAVFAVALLKYMKRWLKLGAPFLALVAGIVLITAAILGFSVQSDVEALLALLSSQSATWTVTTAYDIPLAIAGGVLSLFAVIAYLLFIRQAAAVRRETLSLSEESM